MQSSWDNNAKTRRRFQSELCRFALYVQEEHIFSKTLRSSIDELCLLCPDQVPFASSCTTQAAPFHLMPTGIGSSSPTTLNEMTWVWKIDGSVSGLLNVKDAALPPLCVHTRLCVYFSAFFFFFFASVTSHTYQALGVEGNVKLMHFPSIPVPLLWSLM